MSHDMTTTNSITGTALTAAKMLKLPGSVESTSN
jgi:hypothetical protein